MPHRIDPLLRRDDRRRHLERFLRMEAEELGTLVSLATTELRVGSREQAAVALERAVAEAAELRTWLDLASGQGVELAPLSQRVAALEEAIAGLRQQLAEES